MRTLAHWIAFALIIYGCWNIAFGARSYIILVVLGACITIIASEVVSSKK